MRNVRKKGDFLKVLRYIRISEEYHLNSISSGFVLIYYGCSFFPYSSDKWLSYKYLTEFISCKLNLKFHNRNERNLIKQHVSKI